jgi:hypothetical protein
VAGFFLVVVNDAIRDPRPVGRRPNESAADAVRDAVAPPAQTVRPTGSKVESRTAEIRLKLGTVTRESLAVAVMDLSPILDSVEQAEGVAFAGLLGLDVLGTYEAIVDLQNRQLYLRNTPAEDRAALHGRWRAIGVVHHGRGRDDLRVKAAQVEVSGGRFAPTRGRSAGRV